MWTQAAREYSPDYCDYMQVVGSRLFVPEGNLFDWALLPEYREMRAGSRQVGHSQRFAVGRRFVGIVWGNYKD